MGKFYTGLHILDSQVTGFDMSGMTEGDLTLPTGAVKNISEISDAVKVGVANPALAGGDKLVQEKHLKDLEAALQGQINTVDGKVDAEVIRATAAEGVLQGNIDAEVARATAEELRIEGKHDAYVTSNDAALASEAATRLANDNTLQGNIDALSGAVEADFATMESDFVAALGAEESARIAADAGLSGEIAAERGRLDAILSGSHVDFDTLKEIADAYQLADTDILSQIVTLDGKIDQEVIDRTADVDAEESRATAAEAVLQANIGNEAAARAAADTSATNDRAAIRSEFAAADLIEQNARIAADGVLQGNIDAEAATRLAEDQAIAANLAQELLDRAAGDAQTLVDAKAYTDVREAAEALARSNADTTLQGNIDAEETQRIADDLVLQGNIDSLSSSALAARTGMETFFAGEIGRVESESDAAEATLTANLASEVSRATAAEGVLQGNIDALSSSALTARTGMETFFAGEIAALQSDVDGNEADADAAIAVVAADLASYEVSNDAALAQEIQDRMASVTFEENARIAGDAGLQAQINDIMSNTDPAALDSLTEIVAAFQAEDVNLNGAITTLAATHTSEMNALSGAVEADFAAMETAYIAADAVVTSAFQAADAVLTAGLAQELLDRDAADVVLQDNIDDADARALAAEAILAASITSEEAARIAGDNTLQGNINTLSGAVAADFASMESDFLAEIVRVETESDAAEATLTANLAAEVARAQGEELRIEGKFDNHFDGFVKVAYLTESSVAMGAATHYIVNASSAKSFTVPTMTEEYFFMVKVAEGSSSVTFNAGTGESIDGESDGSITLHGGASVMFVKKGGVMYLF